ncbi:unnamed protein product [Alopecurus aequalis]
MDPAGLLTDYVFLDVLHRLLPRSLAMSRCICKAWRAVIDGHHADLLQLSLEGIFLERYDPGVTPRGRYQEHPIPVLFSRPSTGREIPINICYPPDNCTGEDFEGAILDCCNGLLLLRNDHVVNPATRQWAELPRIPCSCLAIDHKYLVFDPAVWPHYEVFSIPEIPYYLSTLHIGKDRCNDKSISAMEWPPTPYIMNVFTSRTEEWEERSFLRPCREGKAAADCKAYRCYQGAAYCHGAPYVTVEYDFVLRLKLSTNTYQVIELPKEKKEFDVPRLGKSEKGVYCAYRYADHAFQIWFLDESLGQTEWVLKSDINFAPMPWRPRKIASGPWILQVHDNMEEPVLEDNSEWDPDDKNVVSTEHWAEAHERGIYDFLGFHPSKEIALFAMDERVLAYHLSTSKVRDLGEVCKGSNEIQASFMYTPCWMGPLPGQNLIPGHANRSYERMARDAPLGRSPYHQLGLYHNYLPYTRPPNLC